VTGTQPQEPELASRQPVKAFCEASYSWLPLPSRWTFTSANVPATRRQDVANEHQRNDENLGFSSFRPRKGRQDVGAFRKGSYTRS
ncbi:MAG: hypothetical protein ACO37F_14845, partial [Pirellulales bacterium]